jgi:hypothetical protein
MIHHSVNDNGKAKHAVSYLSILQNCTKKVQGQRIPSSRFNHIAHPACNFSLDLGRKSSLCHSAYVTLPELVN